MNSRAAFDHSARAFRTKVIGLGFALIALAVGPLSAPAASAEEPPRGATTVLLGAGRSADALGGAGVKISGAGAAVTTSASRGRVWVETPVTDVSVTAERSVVSLAGSLVFSKGAKRITAGRLSVVVRGTDTTVRGQLGGSVISIFTVKGPAEVDQQVGTVEFTGSGTRLTPGAAHVLAKRFRIAKLPAARMGSSWTYAQAAFEDPYGELCSLPATSKTAGDLPEAKLSPEIANPTTAAGQAISWGFRDQFRSYLHFLPGGQGVMQGFEGGSVNAGTTPPFVPTGFTWTFDSGQFNASSTAVATDQAVLSGSGTIVLCHKTQFRVSLSNPSIVIDGLKAQLVFDVDTNVLGNWIPTQRIALADLITSEGTRTQDANSITWTNVPVSLTEAGSDSLRLAQFSPTFRYQAGQLLKAITFTVSS